MVQIGVLAVNKYVILVIFGSRILLLLRNK